MYVLFLGKQWPSCRNAAADRGSQFQSCCDFINTVISIEEYQQVKSAVLDFIYTLQVSS